jgi:hypothetical protein
VLLTSNCSGTGGWNASFIEHSPDLSLRQFKANKVVCVCVCDCSVDMKRERQPPPLTDELVSAMRSAVQHQLDGFLEEQPRPLLCAFNALHTHGEYHVDHWGQYFRELCRDFIAYDILVVPHEFERDTLTGESRFIESNNNRYFVSTWQWYHQKNARLRVLCDTCTQKRVRSSTCGGGGGKKQRHTVIDLTDKQTKTPEKEHQRPQKTEIEVEIKPKSSVNDMLRPYADRRAAFSHTWLDVRTWGEPNEKGNYTRLLDGRTFTLFLQPKQRRWSFVYDNKFAGRTFLSLNETLLASYEKYGQLIRRYL